MSTDTIAAAPTQATAPAAAALAARDIAPLALAVLPFGLAIGAAVADSELWAPGALAGALLLLAGASQLAVIGLLDDGAGVAIAVSSALLINARFALYSAGLATWFRSEPRWKRLLLAVPLVDQQFLLCQQRFADGEPGADDPAWRRTYYLALSAMLVVCFCTGQVIGFTVGSSLPEGAGLALAAPLAFAGMLGMALRSTTNAVAAIAAGATVVMAAGLPGGLSLPVATLVGITAASHVAARQEEAS